MESPYTIQRGYALIIINDKFPSMRNPDRRGAEVDLRNIKAFCVKTGITIHYKEDDPLKTHDLSFAGMAGLLEEVSKQDFKDYDAFFCFISSHGSQEGILGIDRIAITINQIVDLVMKNETLGGKPKLFFFQNCRGSRENMGQPVLARNLPQEDEDEDPSNIATIPTHADTLIACSSWSWFKSYRDPEYGSSFIAVLTSALLERAKTSNFTDMLQMVNKLLAEINNEKGRRQISCFTSSLRQAVSIKVIDTDQTSGQVIPSFGGQSSET